MVRDEDAAMVKACHSVLASGIAEQLEVQGQGRKTMVGHEHEIVRGAEQATVRL